MKSWLPTEPHTIATSPEKLKYLIIAPPKWGKTTLFAGCPQCLLMAFEAGYGFVKCAKVVMQAWDRSYKERKQGVLEDEDGLVYSSAIETVEELERSNPYQLVIIDTIDEAIKLCSAYNCKKAHVEHPSEGGDYGRGWSKLVTEPFREFYNRLLKTGVGVVVITHSKERTDKDKFGKDRFRRETTLSDTIQQFIVAQSDVIMHGFFARRRRNRRDRDRYVSFDGSDEVIAGSRIDEIYIPNKYILAPRGEGWKQWRSFFTDTPEAGKHAEKDFARLYSGIDDENLVEEEEEQQQEENHNNVYAKTKVNTENTRTSQSGSKVRTLGRR